ncbi:TPA: hypothetical protein ACK1Z8_006247, partial [Klebsiella michiganensis]
DAGLGDNDGVDARERLNTLFKVVPAGFTVKIRGYHIVSGPLKAEEKKDLAIDGHGATISAKELRSEYTVLDYADTNPLVMMTGILSCFKCPGIKIYGLEIQGAMKLSVTNEDGTHKGEEHALLLRSCDGYEVHHTILHNVFGYGCLGLYHDEVSFHHNQVYDVRRESGVNAASGGGRARIYANTFIDCVLYGIEIEGHDFYGGMSYIHAWDNLIIRSKWGIPVVDQCLEAKLHHNTILECHTALAAFRTADYAVISSLFDTNTIRSCLRALFSSNARNATFQGNDVDLADKPDYL